jgi:hypothetical protein
MATALEVGDELVGDALSTSLCLGRCAVAGDQRLSAWDGLTTKSFYDSLDLATYVVWPLHHVLPDETEDGPAQGDHVGIAADVASERLLAGVVGPGFALDEKLQARIDQVAVLLRTRFAGSQIALGLDGETYDREHDGPGH